MASVHSLTATRESVERRIDQAYLDGKEDERVKHRQREAERHLERERVHVRWFVIGLVPLALIITALVVDFEPRLTEVLTFLLGANTCFCAVELYKLDLHHRLKLKNRNR